MYRHWQYITYFLFPALRLAIAPLTSYFAMTNISSGAYYTSYYRWLFKAVGNVWIFTSCSSNPFHGSLEAGHVHAAHMREINAFELIITLLTLSHYLAVFRVSWGHVSIVAPADVGETFKSCWCLRNRTHVNVCGGGTTKR